MKHFYKLYFLLLFGLFYSQNSGIKNEHKLYDNLDGKIITDAAAIKKIEEKKQAVISNVKNKISKTTATQNAVEMCTNGGFEQHETISGGTYLKNFLYTIGDQTGPTQCRAITNVADQYINIFNPNNTNIMASTVPANYIDSYMGDIKAFDQYALKINYKDSYVTSSSVQAKRYKTNNENFLKFNYKAVLQTVYDSGHKDNQPFFKARVLNKKGEVVSEFCLIGDEQNCIFTKIPDGGSDYVTLFTANWQSGMLDISSIPNNEEFTVEFIGSRCGFGAHFGYAYIDDICLLHSNENIQGTVDLDPLNMVCPTFPINVCGSYTVPNSGGITATVKKITLNVYDSNNKVIYTTSTPSSHDQTNKRFCFNLQSVNFPNVTNANYNVGVTVDYDITGTSCGGTNFNSATDADANSGWDISFMNCTSDCNIDLQTAKLYKCDANHDGSEDFNLSDLDSKIVSSTSGLSFTYFKTYNDAVSNLNGITNYINYTSPSSTIYIRVAKSTTCYKIIHASLEVKNPTANISGILNVCSGSTVLTASQGNSYLWNNGATTQSITVTSTGTYSVKVTDSYGCTSTASVVIEPSQTAVLPTIEVTQPSCNSSTGSIKVTSPASEYSFDNGSTWVTYNTLTSVSPGTYKVKIKTVNDCVSYAQVVDIVSPASTYPNYTYTAPKFCGDTGSITITTPAAYYSFDGGSTWTTNNIANNLLPDVYKIITKDINGCTSYVNNVYIYGVSIGTPEYTVVQPACNKKGSITIESKADYYTFDGGSTWSTNNVLNNITSGNYSVGFKNKLGCVSDYQYIYLKDFSDTYPDYSVIQPSCGVNGAIFVKTIGKEYSFDGGLTWSQDNVKDNLPEGTYEIKVKDENGCITETAYVYLYKPYLESPVVYTEQPTCDNNGTITVNTLSDYYSFDGGNTWTTLNKKSLPPGYYNVLIKNKLDCVSNSTYVSLNNPRIPLTDYTVVQPTCDTGGSITINTVADQYSFDGGSTWTTNNVMQNVTSSGYYYLKIKNKEGCVSETVYVYINAAHLDLPAFDAVSPSCGNIGSIKFITTADYYSIDGGSTWSTNPLFTPLNAGYYYLQTKNKNGCFSNTQYLYLDNKYLAPPRVTLVQPTCTTAGSITVNTSADQYSIDGGYTWVTSAVFNNLKPGYYYVQIKDKNGCVSSSQNVTINQFYLPDPKFTHTDPTCGTGGTITFTTTADFYSIDSGNTWSTSNNFTNLKSGYYYLKIKNSQGCVSDSYSSYVYINEYYLPNPDYTVVQPSCSTSGSISIATVADQYSFDGGSTWSTNPTITGVKSGYYNLVIKNTKGCISNPYRVNVRIDTFYLPTPVIKVQQPTCGNGGSITVVTSAAQYSFDGGKTFSTNPILSSPAPGSYNIVIKNNLGCVSYEYPVYINKYYLQSPSISSVQPTCSSPYGTIYVITAADQYSFDGGTTWTTDNFKTNLTGGSYYVVIKNSSGCTSQSRYEYIYQPPSIPAAPQVTVKQPSACGVTDGSITINTLGVSYSFNDGASWIPSNTKVNLGAGTYIIRVKTNSYSCDSAPTIVNLDSGTTIAAPDFTVTQPTCSVSTGSISITSPGDNFSFDNGLSYVYANTKTNLLPGTYYVKYRNAAGCISDAAKVTVQKPSDLPAPKYSVVQPDCSVSTGSITISTSAALYSFDKGVTFGTSNSISNLAAGTYDLMIKDSAGCISLVSSVTINPKPNVTETPLFQVSHPTGCSSNLGTVKITTVANEYSFDDGTTWGSSSSVQLPTGIYYIRIRIGSNCPSDRVQVTIDAPPNAPTAPKFNVIHPASCVNPFGKIVITDTVYEYSFDNGKTYSRNPDSGSIAPGIYNLKVRNNAGCESSPVSVTVNKPTDYPSLPVVNVQQIDCLHKFASITVTNSGAEFSIDNGVTWQTSSLFSNLVPNKYSVLIKNTSGCISEVKDVIINTFINPTPIPTGLTTQNFCIQDNAKLVNINISGTNIKWYDAASEGNMLNSGTALSNGNTYYASQTIGSCESERTPFTVNIQNTAAPAVNSPQSFCISENATLAKVTASGSSIKWYDSPTGGNLLSSGTVLQNAKTYYASQTENLCESMARTPVLINLVASTIVANDYQRELCDQGNDNKETVNLKDYESNILINPASYNFNYFDAKMQPITNVSSYQLSTGSNDFYVNISTAKGCDKMVKLTLKLNAVPVVTLPQESEYCSANPVSLDAGSGFTSYEWRYNGSLYSNQQVIYPTGFGTYSLVVTNSSGCSSTVSTKVVMPANPVIKSISIVNATAVINMEISGNYEFSLDQIQWQSSNTFSNLNNGSYNVFVRYRGKVCGLAKGIFTIFDIPNVITPNGDNQNETWKIKDIEIYKGTTVKVFNKFGDVVFEKIINEPFEWNGKLNGRPLPTDSYYYIIKLSDGRVFTGYLLIKNRN